MWYNVLSLNLTISKKHMIANLDYDTALIFDRCHSSCAAEAPVKFQKRLNKSQHYDRYHGIETWEIWGYNVLSDIETAPYPYQWYVSVCYLHHGFWLGIWLLLNIWNNSQIIINRTIQGIFFFFKLIEIFFKWRYLYAFGIMKCNWSGELFVSCRNENWWDRTETKWT